MASIASKLLWDGSHHRKLTAPYTQFYYGHIERDLSLSARPFALGLKTPVEKHQYTLYDLLEQPYATSYTRAHSPRELNR